MEGEREEGKIKHPKSRIEMNLQSLIGSPSLEEDE